MEMILMISMRQNNTFMITINELELNLLFLKSH